VTAGGTAIDTTVSTGGVEVLSRGGRTILGPNTGGTATGTILDGGTEYVNISGIASGATVNSGGSQVVTGGYYHVLGSEFPLYGAGAADGTTVNSGGTQFVYLSATAYDTTVNSGGRQVVTGGYYSFLGSEFSSYGGGAADSTTVNSGGTEVVYLSASASNTTVNSGGTEFLYSGNEASGTSLNVGGSIDASYLPYAGGGSAGVNTSSVLTVSVGGQTYTQQLSGDYADVRFQLAEDTASGTLVTAEVPCFRSFTRILTDRGEVAVESLRVGDLVQTVLGGTLTPITWIGRREVDCTRHPRPQRLWPVRVAAGAFGPGRPHSDLFLSPDHAIYSNNVLIPIRYLINASTITQIPMARVTYYHLELPHHDVLLAEGLPAESFLDLRDGSNYANRPGPTRLYPDFSARMWEAFGCARLVVTGPEFLAAQAQVENFADRQAA